MKRALVFISFLVFATALIAAPAAKSLLSVDDVMKATGLKGVVFVEKGSKSAAVGDLNFTNSAGDFILMVQVIASTSVDNAKTTYKTLHTMKGYSRGDLTGLGDEAFFGPKDDPQYMVVFRKGTTVVSINTNLDILGDDPTFLTVEQLKTIAGLITKKL